MAARRLARRHPRRNPSRRRKSLLSRLWTAGQKRARQNARDRERQAAQAQRDRERGVKAAARAEATRIRQAERAIAALERKKQTEIARYEHQKAQLEEKRRRRESAELDRQIKDAQRKAKGARQRGDAREDRMGHIARMLEAGRWNELSDADKDFFNRHARAAS